MKPIWSIIFACILAIITSCSDEPGDEDINTGETTRGIFIVNEGNYGSGNASLSFYEPGSFIVEQNVFQRANGFPPGDALQSIKIIDSLAYLTVSNSGKILVFNKNTFTYVASITGLLAPRYLEALPGNRLIVSDLHNPSLTIVNTVNWKIEDEIYVGKSTEQMVKSGDYLFVASWSFNNAIYKINISDYSLTGTLETGIQPNSLVVDKSGMLWVLCDGGYAGNPFGHEHARLQKIDPFSFTVEKTFVFPDLQSSPSELSINKGGDTLYFINSSWAGNTGSSAGVFRMPVTDQSLPEIAFIPQEEHLFYSLGIDPNTSGIYCSDAIDYLQKGLVLRYDPQGKLVDSFKAGIIPGFFAFR